jgi:hypothetical protein
MGKEQSEIIARLRLLEMMCFADSPKIQIINETIDALQKLGGDRPEGANPRLKNAAFSWFFRETTELLDRALTSPTKDRRLYTMRIIQWYVNCAVETLENGNSP